MNDLIEVSYTGDILAHRRCARAWAYEKQAGFHPYEQVQAMEGRLLHHAMEWLTRFYSDNGRHAKATDLDDQLNSYFRVLWAKGIRTAFTSKAETLERVRNNLFPGGTMHSTVEVLIEGAQHSEYEIRAVRKVLPAQYGGKSRVLLTGVVDLVVQQESPLSYPRVWKWTDRNKLLGQVEKRRVAAKTGDLEIWDYKGTRASTRYLADYVRQVVTYAALYRERAGSLPARCVLFFVNEVARDEQLLAININDALVNECVKWTQDEVQHLRQTTLAFEADPLSIEGGDITLQKEKVGKRVTDELTQQCTTCGRRFDCDEYGAYLRRANGSKKMPRDIDPLDVGKN